MGRIYVFADEAGNFDFRIGRGGASKYYSLGTLTTSDVSVGDRLLDLRRNLAWHGVALGSCFHATEDTQVVRDSVFNVLIGEQFRFDVTIFDKSKTPIGGSPTTWAFRCAPPAPDGLPMNTPFPIR